MKKLVLYTVESEFGLLYIPAQREQNQKSGVNIGVNSGVNKHVLHGSESS